MMCRRMTDDHSNCNYLKAGCDFRDGHRTGKEGTSRIERYSLNFRTRLKRLQRHTICYSKSAVMHDAVIKLYAHHSNAGRHHF
jgi:IS1 family transposase